MMNTVVSLLILAVQYCNGFSISCDPEWSYLEHTGMCYKYDPTNRTWTDALVTCVESNSYATLASIHDNTTNSFLTNLTGGSEWTWIGGYQDDADEWTWADGSEWTGFNPWGPGQPDNLWGKDDHLGLNYPRAGEWNDFSGDYPQGSICQYDPSKTTDYTTEYTTEYTTDYTNDYTSDYTSDYTTDTPTSCGPVGYLCFNSWTNESIECCEGFCAFDTHMEPGYCVLASTDTTSCAAVGSQCYDPETYEAMECCEGFCTVDSVTSAGYCMLPSTVSPSSCAAEGTQCWDPETASPTAGVDCCDGFCAVDSPLEPGYCMFPSTASPTSCASGWSYLEHTGMCYKHDPTNRTWTDAAISCALSIPPSTLASVHDNETNEFLTTLTGGSEWTWIGGYQDDADEWNWADESEWTEYRNWGPGQPDNLWGKDDHLGLNYPGAGDWNDFSGDYPQGSICQYDPFQTAATSCFAEGTQCYDPETGFEDVECCEGYCGVATPMEPGYCSTEY